MLERDGIIYIVTCILNGKSYIGKTWQTLHARKMAHKRKALSDSDRFNSAFHAAIRKHGWENFEWKIIDRCLFPDMLCELEKIYIKQNHSQSPEGYNLTAGGAGKSGFKCSVETRKKMSDTSKRNMSDGLRNKISESMKGERNHMWGKHHSEETKKKMSEAQKGEKSYLWGKHHSVEIRNKISLSKCRRLNHD